MAGWPSAQAELIASPAGYRGAGAAAAGGVVVDESHLFTPEPVAQATDERRTGLHRRWPLSPGIGRLESTCVPGGQAAQQPRGIATRIKVPRARLTPGSGLPAVQEQHGLVSSACGTCTVSAASCAAASRSSAAGREGTDRWMAEGPVRPANARTPLPARSDVVGVNCVQRHTGLL